MINDQQQDLTFFLALPLSLGRARNKKLSKSSLESEYRALGHTTSKFLWLHWLLRDLVILITGPTRCILIVIELRNLPSMMCHERTKQFEVDYHFICRNARDENI